ncbi:hypothetical protein ACN38_g9631 [Penicillium nordicum]|uniref:Uncharacterized protein n=1 Tax=Penicillium nordicum TaxID=229535 RepID=A0A0M9WCE7_9EURO|nr:hypothetical protein ACN38_g9631 [Penicillium nordicum]
MYTYQRMVIFKSLVHLCCGVHIYYIVDAWEFGPGGNVQANLLHLEGGQHPPRATHLHHNKRSVKVHSPPHNFTIIVRPCSSPLHPPPQDTSFTG